MSMQTLFWASIGMIMGFCLGYVVGFKMAKENKVIYKPQKLSEMAENLTKEEE